MSIWLVLLLMVAALVGGWVLYPYTIKYVMWLKGKFVSTETELEKKIKVVKNKVEYQLDIAKEKSLEVEGELAEIKEDLEDIWQIIKR